MVKSFFSFFLSFITLSIGNAIAAEIRQQLTSQINLMENKPGLAVILVGNRTDSATYVRMKRKACQEVGIHNFSVDYDENVTQEELLAKSKLYILLYLFLFLPFTLSLPPLLLSFTHSLTRPLPI